MFYGEVFDILRVLTGLSMLFGSVLTLLAALSTHPDRRRSEVIPIVLVGVVFEVLLALCVLTVFSVGYRSMASVVILSSLMIMSVCASMMRLYYLGLMRSLFVRDEHDGT